MTKKSNNNVGFINPGSPMGPLRSKNSAWQTALQRRVTLGPAQIPNNRPEERSSLRPEGLAKEGTTLASDSNPLIRPKGLAKEGTTLASDSDPLLRPGIHRTSAYDSSPTGVVEANWERPAGDVRLVRTQEIRRSR